MFFVAGMSQSSSFERGNLKYAVELVSVDLPNVSIL